MNLGACGGLTRFPLTGTWYRALNLSFLPSALSTLHTRRALSRFNAGSNLAVSDQFPILYLAADPITAQYEFGAVFSDTRGTVIPNPHVSYAMLNVQISLSEVFDLTDVTAAQTPLGVTAQELTGDWRGYDLRGPHSSVKEPIGIAPTQELGAALSATGVEGFQTISARVPTSRVLVVFPNNLRARSYVVYRDDSGTVVHHIP